jgi:DNA-binding MarR family transcriptional regulator
MNGGRWTNTDLGVMASQLLIAVEDELFGRLHERGFQEIVPRHRSVLAHLSAEGLRATELARRSGQLRQVIGDIVDDLEALGCVERRPDPADRRAKLVVPTARGRRQLETADAIMSNILRRHARVLGTARFACFLADFRLVIDCCGRPMMQLD